ncbi:MurR/RpiR family transcriptional regulator [Mammaliicoccus sciuri]|uniref:MurR/RpiR family transcriptional regulator n=1 Tax=Mammaliicoccus sciuri TaxID=1296 RepID=A0AB37HUP0_MAMSC|nr:MurR/RpiR family transcriptional regulator [Mammaliicoccus sciuri]MCD8818318.1 MurR/RpiR family transcriptional regulator [Mammaliicoccus sciuri]MCJ0968408.1 MurR/RpiR family transcriptional regulator [Mammaliicoccus sciuri]MDT0696488.1 MurR/RpiR family transcriptional regulator [Mammaliicoccus sciuri]MEB6340549.1 MurR/RpiR family transcriptional regulator [Mammaliicoccus sciuri]MEB7400614.1 MurR/RpiR family transcriptional regulator [Mammaliicoccus sciuri]
MILDKLINEHYQQLNDNDIHIIQMINQNIHLIHRLKIQEIADISHTSISSIHRLARKLGFDGYSDFKAYIKLNRQTSKPSTDIIESLEQDLQQTMKHLKMIDYDYISEQINQAPYIYIYGTGVAQLNVARDAQRHFLSINKRVMVINDENELKIAMNQMNKDDLIFIISLSGETSHLRENVEIMHTRNISYISITTLKDNYLAQNASHNIYVNSSPIELFNQTSYSSFLPYHIAFEVIVRKFSEWKLAH